MLSYHNIQIEQNLIQLELILIQLKFNKISYFCLALFWIPNRNIGISCIFILRIKLNTTSKFTYNQKQYNIDSDLLKNVVARPYQGFF